MVEFNAVLTKNSTRDFNNSAGFLKSAYNLQNEKAKIPAKEEILNNYQSRIVIS